MIHTHFKCPDTKLITATEASALALLPINGVLVPKGKPAVARDSTADPSHQLAAALPRRKAKS